MSFNPLPEKSLCKLSIPDGSQQVEAQVRTVVAAIPKGKVVTYGQVARFAGIPQQSRLVGRILSRLPEGTTLPWHRVINSQGRISNPNPDRQRARLQREGVSAHGNRVRLRDYQWIP
jgi:methylated-DNA-protein-cysteine methyltransferase related protein